MIDALLLLAFLIPIALVVYATRRALRQIDAQYTRAERETA